MSQGRFVAPLLLNRLSNSSSMFRTALNSTIARPTTQINLPKPPLLAAQTPTLFRPTHSLRKMQLSSGILAVVFDVGGTLAITYCSIPEEAFNDTLKYFGIHLPREVIRAPMGENKLVHFIILAKEPKFKEDWFKEHKREFTSADLTIMYEYFLKRQIQLLREKADVIPFAKERLIDLGQTGVKRLITSGWDPATLDTVLDITQLKSHVDVWVGSAEKHHTRSVMVKSALEQAGIPEAQWDQVVFVSDSANDFRCVAKNIPQIKKVAVARFGTHMGIDNFLAGKNMGTEERTAREAKATEILWEAGADVVISDLSYLLKVTFDTGLRQQARCTP